MKRTLFLALLFLTITGFAQKSGSVVFDFSKPTLLSVCHEVHIYI